MKVGDFLFQGASILIILVSIILVFMAFRFFSKSKKEGKY
ncbi:hypothetical protein GGR98_002268 [Parageobacillus caldoxylosilyticus]|jgi:hypothetical protein|nr:hypothetical protein [Parageobacillus caldoxylosilyticus]